MATKAEREVKDKEDAAAAMEKIEAAAKKQFEAVSNSSFLCGCKPVPVPWRPDTSWARSRPAAVGQRWPNGMAVAASASMLGVLGRQPV
jgi:hypothetical protein